MQTLDVKGVMEHKEWLRVHHAACPSNRPIGFSDKRRARHTLIKRQAAVYTRSRW